MKSISRPWSLESLDDIPFSTEDCLLSEAEDESLKGIEYSLLMKGSIRDTTRCLLLHPYPKKHTDKSPSRENFPKRPTDGQKPLSDLEVKAQKTLIRMKQVTARVQELKNALDNPMDVWARLRAAWE